MIGPNQKIHQVIFPISILVYGIFTFCLLLLLFIYKPYQPAECQFKIYNIQQQREGNFGILSASSDMSPNTFNSSFDLKLTSAHDADMEATVRVMERIGRRNGAYVFRVMVQKLGDHSAADRPLPQDTLIGKTLVINKMNRNLFQYLFF